MGADEASRSHCWPEQRCDRIARGSCDGEAWPSPAPSCGLCGARGLSVCASNTIGRHIAVLLRWSSLAFCGRKAISFMCLTASVILLLWSGLLAGHAPVLAQSLGACERRIASWSLLLAEAPVARPALHQSFFASPALPGLFILGSRRSSWGAGLRLVGACC